MIFYTRQPFSPRVLKLCLRTTDRATERQKHLRNLKDVRIVMALENIPYDILIHTSCQYSADKVGSHNHLREDRVLFKATGNLMTIDRL